MSDAVMTAPLGESVNDASSARFSIRRDSLYAVALTVSMILVAACWLFSFPTQGGTNAAALQFENPGPWRLGFALFNTIQAAVLASLVCGKARAALLVFSFAGFVGLLLGVTECDSLLLGAALPGGAKIFLLYLSPVCLALSVIEFLSPTAVAK